MFVLQHLTELLDGARHDVVEELEDDPAARDARVPAHPSADLDVHVPVPQLRVELLLDGHAVDELLLLTHLHLVLLLDLLSLVQLLLQVLPRVAPRPFLGAEVHAWRCTSLSVRRPPLRAAPCRAPQTGV